MSQPTKQQKKSGRAWKIILGVVVGLIAIAVAAYAVDYLVNKDKVPRGTSVGGVEIGGMAKPEASRTLQRELGGVESEPVIVTAAELTSNFIPAEAGLGIDWDATVEAAGEESANPITRLAGLFSTQEVDVISTVDETALAPQMDRVQEELAAPAADGGVEIVDGNVETIDPVLGQEVDREELTTQVTESWLDPEGIEVDALPVEPVINQEVIDQVANGPAAEAVSGPLVVRGQDGTEATIEPASVGQFVSFVPAEGTLRPEVDTEVATGILAEQLVGTETEGTNARLNSDGSVTPHTDGTVVDWEETMMDFPARVVGDAERTWDAAYVADPADFTTEMAEAATFDEVVGEFTTSGYSETSGHNISVIAAEVDGVIVAPGETFSLNSFTGPRGLAQGYVEGGTIENGRAGTAVGGGISQFATTLYNAYYFAGMEDIAHTPHSYYISRYPAGREATIYEGAIDLVFRNNSENPVRIDTSVGGGSLTVQLMGVKTREVESISGGRWDRTEPDVRNISGDDCIPSSGNPGFTTSDTRVVRDLAGNELANETQTTVYDPQPIVRCS